MRILFYFLRPYYQLLHGAAANVQQCLEGLGWRSSVSTEIETNNYAMYSAWEIGPAVNEVFVWIIAYAVFLCAILLVAGYIVGHKRGLCIAAFLLLLPGILSIFGVMPSLNFEPEIYVLGGGILGSWKGMLPLLLLGVITGWCLMIIIVDTVNLSDKFRQYYDHFWYLSALLTAVFFVFDTQSNYQIKELEQTNQLSRQTSLYFLDQVKRYHGYCQSLEMSNSVSCKWASRVQQQLNEYASQDQKVYYLFGPQSSRDIYDPYRYGISDNEITEIRREIQLYNQEQCPVVKLNDFVYQHAKPSANCQFVPAQYCTGLPEPPVWNEPNKSLISNEALASECLIPTLVMQRHQQEKLVLDINEQQRAKYYRWIFYLLFSFVVGGKIANSTSKAIDLDKRDKSERQRILPVLNSIRRACIFLFLKGYHLIVHSIHSIYDKLKILFQLSKLHWSKRKNTKKTKNK